MPEVKRIIELDPTSVIPADAQLPVDSPSIGSRKISWPDLLDLILAEADEAVAAAGTFAATAGVKAAEAQQSADDAADEKTAAQTARTGAEAAQGVATTQAGIATTQAGIATVKAGEAAASAVLAQNAIADNFKGGVAGSAVPNTLPLAGDYYVITSAGTSQGITWAVGDSAIYNGTSGSWTQLVGYFNGHQAIIDSGVLSRASIQMLVSDGSNAAIYAPFIPLTLPLGSSFDFTVIVESSDTTHPMCIISSRSSAGGGGAGVVFFWYSGGEFGYYSGTASNAAQNFAFIPRDGKRHLLHVAVTAGSAKAWVDGVEQNIVGLVWGTSTGQTLEVFAETTVGTSSPTFFGKAALLGITNYNMSAADREYLRLNGVYKEADRGGSMTALNTSAWSNTTMDVFTGASTTGFSGGSTGVGNKFAKGTAFIGRSGKRVRVSFNWQTTSGVKPWFQIYEFSTLAIGAPTEGVVVEGSNSFVFTIPTNGDNWTPLITFGPTGVGEGILSNFLIINEGTLVQYGAWDGTGVYWPSANGDAKHLFLGPAGVYPLLKSSRGSVAAGFQSTLYGPPPIITAQIVAAGVYTTGQVIASVVGNPNQNTSGIFLITNSANGVRLVGLSRTPYYGDASDTATDVLALGASGPYGLPVTLKVSTTSGVPTFDLIATENFTAAVTNTVWLQHLAGSLPYNLVK